MILTLDCLFRFLVSKAKALANLSTAEAHEAYRKEVEAAGGLWTAGEVSAALKLAPKLLSLGAFYDRGKKRTVTVPKGKTLPHLEDLCRRCKGIPR